MDFVLSKYENIDKSKNSMENKFNKYVLFWFSQTISQLGSSMTGFALILWIYMQNGSAMEVSLMTFFNYIPYIIASMFSGAVVDQYEKKKILVISDTLIAVCSGAVFIFCVRNCLQIYHVYILNFIAGIMKAFQEPASSVIIGKMISKDKISQASGLTSFSANLNMVLTPVFATALFAFCRLDGILIFDLLTFLFAVLILIFVVEIPEAKTTNSRELLLFRECKEGLSFLKNHKKIWLIIITMAMLNFFSRLTYENILSPMILARSGDDTMVLGVVNAVMGIAGIVGGMIVASGRALKESVKMIYLPAIFSFLFGDLLMGLGRNVWMWSLAAVAASLPIPFIIAGQNVILYDVVPENMQGRVFAVRNAIQYSTIPLGILLGGMLADYVFEPMMMVKNEVTGILSWIVGNGAGSGMAVMFLCTGLLGSMFSLIAYSKLRKSL